MKKVSSLKNKAEHFVKGKFTKDGVGWLVSQQLVLAPLSLLTTVLLTRILSISDYGYYKYALSMLTIFSIFSFTGVSTIAQLNLQKGQDEYFSLAFYYRKILRWIPVVVTLATSGYYFYKDNLFLSLVFASILIYFFFSETYNFYSVATLGKGDFRQLFLLEVGNYIISFFPPLLAAFFLRNNEYVVVFVLATTFFCQFLFRYWAFHFISKLYNFDLSTQKSLSKEEIGQFKNQTINSTLSGGVSVFFANANTIVVFNRLGAVDSAVYSLATTFTNFASSLVSSPMSKILLTLNKMADEVQVPFIINQIKKYFLYTFAITLVVISSTPLLYYFLFPKYFNYYPLAILYSLSLLALSFTPAQYYFLQRRKFSLLNTLQVFFGVLNISILLLALKFYGLYGVIFAQVFISFLNSISTTVLMYNDHN